MKFLILLIFCFIFIYSQGQEKSLKIENNLDNQDNVQIDITSNADNSFSFGLFSDKIPMAVFDYTKLFNIDNSSEYYLSI